MLQLSALALDWRANLVEATVFKSFLFGIEGIYPRQHHIRTMSNVSALPIFQVYNSTLLNDHIHKKLSADVSMDRFEEFLGKAAREVTLVHFSTEKFIIPHIRRISPDSSLDLLAAKFAFRRSIYIADCSPSNLNGFTRLAKKVEHHLNNKVRSLQQDGSNNARLQTTIMSKPFNIKRVLCLDPKNTYTSETLAKYVALPGTVVFTNWLGCCFNECTIQNIVPDHNVNEGDKVSESSAASQSTTCEKSLRFSVPTKKLYLGRVREAQFFHHSRIMYSAKRQLEFLGLDSPVEKGYVSVHIRIERILMTALETSRQLWARIKLDFLEQCVRKIVSRLRELQSLLNNSQGETTNLVAMDTRYLLITDVGEQGTSSLTKSTLNSDAQLFLKILKSHGIQVHHCNLGLLRDLDAQNSGFVSLVEMTMLALGEKLLLIGGGGFQVNTAHKFYSLHRKKRDVLRESCVL